ncbi:universal stress protein [Halogeometricum luteum]|uniref:Universal stress protein n=1 Tax=Halogeometricum luteum TaxID=2950537 RepID=A0ABU2G3M4_9EURY|nr:universal stress protein [Halogeometricum sp. S3BR5-2]MDS0295391.1 universal stress protein [Halogeometricum sp. S3BR5-2]
MHLFDHLLVPVADERDAVATADALTPHLEAVDRITAVHVVQKAGGAVDKAPLVKRQQDGIELLAAVERALWDEDVVVRTRIAYGRNVAATIVDAALETDATAIAFRSRGGNRLVRWLSGDTAVRLVSNPDIPVVSLGTSDGSTTGAAPNNRARGDEVRG